MRDAICFLCDSFAHIVSEPDSGKRLYIRCPKCREYVVVTSWLQRPKTHSAKAALADVAKATPAGMMLLIEPDDSKVVERSVALIQPPAPEAP